MRTTIDIPGDKRPPQARQRIFARSAGTGFSVHAAGRMTEIELYGEIGWDVTAAAFKAKLASVTGNIVLKINSPGGNVFDGIAIHNDLVGHRGDVRVEITGIAASAASIVAMAGTEIAIASNAFMMIHRAWGLTVGNTADHAETSALLAQIDGALATTYAQRSGQDVGQIRDWMDGETWFSAAAAIDAGFADEPITAPDDAVARANFDLSVYAKAPGALCKPLTGGLAINSKADLEQILRTAGASRTQAMAIVAGGFTALNHSPEIAALAAQIAAATTVLKGTTS